MATKRKKKTEVQVEEKVISQYEVDVGLAKLPAIVTRTGTHLTVTTFPDGHQELKWDDEALLREVREAIASVEK